MIVTRFAWIAHKLVSSNKLTKYASAASCSARSAVLWNLRSFLNPWAISRTNRWNGSFRMSRSVDFWYFLICRKATVPGLEKSYTKCITSRKSIHDNIAFTYVVAKYRQRWGFLMPPFMGADFRAAFVANCLRGALSPYDLRAVCLIRAMCGLYEKMMELSPKIYKIWFESWFFILLRWKMHSRNMSFLKTRPFHQFSHSMQLEFESHSCVRIGCKENKFITNRKHFYIRLSRSHCYHWCHFLLYSISRAFASCLLLNLDMEEIVPLLQQWIHELAYELICTNSKWQIFRLHSWFSG